MCNSHFGVFITIIVMAMDIVPSIGTVSNGFPFHWRVLPLLFALVGCSVNSQHNHQLFAHLSQHLAGTMEIIYFNLLNRMPLEADK